MCTAISLTVKDNYFGRNLDFEHDFGEKITITPRNYGFEFRNGGKFQSHFALIGMALVMKDYPLYFDATNEKGLSMAGLNFPENAVYANSQEGKFNVASFELIPWILAQCETVKEARELFERTNITNEAFDKKMPPSPLHWLVADEKQSITVEQTKEGLKIYENPVGVLTNNPSFDIQMLNLSNFLNITPEEPKNRFSKKINLQPYSRGMGGIGLPGDISSMSRFVRACFVKLNSDFGESEQETVNRFFHILYSVYQQKGCAAVGDKFEMTNYSSCCNTKKGIYYYTTYNNMSINSVDMHKEDLNGKELISHNLILENNLF